MRNEKDSLNEWFSDHEWIFVSAHHKIPSQLSAADFGLSRGLKEIFIVSSLAVHDLILYF